MTIRQWQTRCSMRTDMKLIVAFSNFAKNVANEMTTKKLQSFFTTVFDFSTVLPAMVRGLVVL